MDNPFDASVDAFVFATEREGFQGVQIVVSETGWPTGGGEAASVANAMAYNENVLLGLFQGKRRPLQPEKM
ncbi:hypothetical protein OIU76_030551 [Salix suchowensis]|nr:hypothetical protein OIU76_030551 [Salix suchowensis]